MSGFILVVVCNAVNFAIVGFFKDFDGLKKFGHHRMPEVLGIGALCLFIYMFGTYNGMVMVGVVPGRDPISIMAGAIIALGLLTAFPWVIKYAQVFMDTVSSIADSIYGLNANLLDKAELKLAHEYLMKGKRQEAIAELGHQCQKYPESYSPLFLLALLAEEDKDIDKAVDLYREIIQKHADNQVPWTNAATNLARLLRDELNDNAAAKNLEQEILKRNPDTKYKYSTTAKPPQKKKRSKKKNRNIQAEKADMNQARRLVTRGEHPQAIALMKRYITENPEDHRSHFELISLFERVERTDDAIIWSQKVIRSFDDNDTVWGDAMIRLAGLRQHGDQDLDATVGLLEQVATRLKHAKHGQLAREQLKDIRSRPEN